MSLYFNFAVKDAKMHSVEYTTLLGELTIPKFLRRSCLV